MVSSKNRHPDLAGNLQFRGLSGKINGRSGKKIGAGRSSSVIEEEGLLNAREIKEKRTDLRVGPFHFCDVIYINRSYEGMKKICATYPTFS